MLSKKRAIAFGVRRQAAASGFAGNRRRLRSSSSSSVESSNVGAGEELVVDLGEDPDPLQMRICVRPPERA